METLLDHVFITVKDFDRSIAFYETALKPLGIVHAIDYDGKDGPEGHPDLKGFGRCERFRSRRLQSRGGLQELATPPIVERRSRQRKSNPQYVRDTSGRV